MSFRPGFRLLFANARPAFRQPAPALRRSVQTAPNPATQSKVLQLWNSPVGPKTVHFWAPIMKWALVLTGVSDFARPADQLSLTQNLALMSTGAIWTRWCFIIRPKNMFLAAVNFFLFIVGSTQVARILMHEPSAKAAESEIKAEGVEIEEELKKAGEEVKKIVKS